MVELQVTGGTVRGVTQDGVSRFLGVPYAAPPFGEHRMKPPAPVVPWNGTRSATDYGPTVPKGDYPPQFQPLFEERKISGDGCLNLNVWTPADAGGGEPLPVLVWIHGGSFTNGSGSVRAYDGTAFARDGIVCVTINYRLGAEGFLYTEEDRDTGHANLGLQDQVAALRWVQDNIAVFGGDPARVTVAGQSAGAMSVTTLLAMPTAAGLFAQAIAASGAAANTLTAETGGFVARTLADALGTDASREAIAAGDLDVVVKATSDLVAEVQSAPDPEKWGALVLSMLPFAPVVDGTVLPQHPLDAIAESASRNVPLLVGSTQQEARLFLVTPGTIDEVDDAGLAAGAAAYGLTTEGLGVYRRHHPGASAGDLMAQVVTDWYYTVPAIRLAEAHEQGGGTSWAYRFDRPLPEANHRLGAAHAVDTPFVFGTIHNPENALLVGDAPSQAVADTAHGAWARFVKHGDPGWAPYTSATRTVGLLTETVTAVDDPDGDLRQTWDGIR